MIKTKKLLILILLIVYSLFFAEFFVRIFSPEKIMPRYVTSTDYGIRGNIKNSSYWHTTPDTRVHMRINSKGIRADKEYSYIKEVNHCRVVIFGDSFFMGYEVSLEKSFAYLLEKGLKSAGYPCEVINLAVSGFGTAEMLISLQNEGIKYQPDLVIFQWHESDLDENLRSGLFNLKNNQLIATGKTFLPGIKTRDWLMQFSLYRLIIEHSQLYSALREYAATKIKKLLASQSSKTTEPAESVTQQESALSSNKLPYKVNLSGQLLLQAKHYVESLGAHFLVVDVPVKWKGSDMYTSLVKLPENVIQSLNIVAPLDTFDTYTSKNELLYYENGAGHWNETGNSVVTELTLEKIRTEGLLDKFKQ